MQTSNYLLNDYTSNFKARLIALQLLPLVYLLELDDILFCLSRIKSPPFISPSLILSPSISMPQICYSLEKVAYPYSKTNHSKHFYFNKLPRLWNALPPIDLEASIITTKKKLKDLFYNYFINFDSINSCSYHFQCPNSKCSYSSPLPIV